MINIIKILIKLKNKILINFILSLIMTILNIIILFFFNLLILKIFFKNIFIIKDLFIISSLIRFISIIIILLKYNYNLINHKISLDIIKKLRLFFFKKIFFNLKINKYINLKYELLTLISLNLEKLDNLYVKFFLQLLNIIIYNILLSFISYFLLKKFYIFVIFIILIFLLNIINYIFFTFFFNKIFLIKYNFISKIILFIKCIKELFFFYKNKKFIKVINILENNLFKIYIFKNLLNIYYEFIISLIFNIFIIYIIYILNFSLNSNIILFFYLILNNLNKMINDIFIELLDSYLILKSNKNINNFFLLNKKKLKKKIYEHNSYKKNSLISIYNLSYKYNKKNYVLKNIFLKINNKSKNLILGDNGSGKTTLFKIINKLISYKHGNIFLKNILLENWKEKDFRNYISSSIQNSYIFNTNLIKNINILNKIKNKKKILTLLKKLKLNFYIKKNIFNINNIKNIISFGEKKIIEIFRILIKKSKISILDEPTDGLNNKLENKILNTIFKENKKKTLIIFSHFLKFPKKWNNIYILENGKIKEYGNHYDLIKLKGKYLNYYKNFLEYKKFKL